ncbi:sulfatase-like hydrolase/transferase [Treponema sp. OMZ 799]|uniref:sulfatase-like hydrolase/transferase n=1 Tax=Treponema sp. OMZ 799 TaxID=2563668 RepID=UPI0020A4F80A|nr:sulfatase-like hydrolase/transferase [Treponema sp. OMZ 799]UTC77818.1 sulfatase-like hydrolase/transferase [Treponema sp. OMZ 799]
MFYFASFICLTIFSVILYKVVNFKEVKFTKALLSGFVITIIAQVITFTLIRIIMGYNLLQVNATLNPSRLKFVIKFNAVSFLCETLLIFFIRIFKVRKEIINKDYKPFISSIIVFLYVLLLMIFVYMDLFFPSFNIDQLLFTLGMPIAGTSSLIILGFIIIIVIIPLFIFFINYFFIKKKIRFTFKLKSKSTPFFPIYFTHNVPFILIWGLFFVLFLNFKLELIDYVKLILKPNSLFYEQNYIDPRVVKFNFPKTKKNLIFIYLESVEAEASTTANPGVNLIPELSQLAEENISFSHNDNLGGQLQLAGTGWSMASLCCTHLGLPLTLPIGGNSYENTKHFFNGAYGLGDLLKDNGYNLSFTMGADAEFGGLRALLTTHGNFNIKDLNYYRQSGKVSKDYFVWWGIEDKKIIEYSKEELINLSNDGKPFMFSVFLEDTHSPGGYMDEDCNHLYQNQIHNVFSCTSKRVGYFVEWIKNQKFYNDTVIVILGDHLYMGGDLYNKKKTIYERHAYNVFINSAKTTKYSKNRAFATFDFFPTIVEALGIEYAGNGLGIGRSLFSNEPTLLEQYGERQLNEFINSRSRFYRDELLNKKDIPLE